MSGINRKEGQLQPVLIFAGTTEGRRLAWELSLKGIPSLCSVATEYGEMVMREDEEKSPLIHVRTGRMDPEKMEAFIRGTARGAGDEEKQGKAAPFLAVVDATHPFAKDVSLNIKRAVKALRDEGVSIPFFRLLRDPSPIPGVQPAAAVYPGNDGESREGNGENDSDDIRKRTRIKTEGMDDHPDGSREDEKIIASGRDSKAFAFLSDKPDRGFSTSSLSDSAVAGDSCIFYDTVPACVEGLAKTQGSILLTTGSKDLPYFCKDASMRERITARILPSAGSLEIAYAQGLTGKQIIAMQGPFSEELNLALIRQYHIENLVTKESGDAGGFLEKKKAATKAGIICHVIRRPKEEKDALSFDAVLCRITALAGIKEDEAAQKKTGKAPEGSRGAESSVPEGRALNAGRSNGSVPGGRVSEDIMPEGRMEEKRSKGADDGDDLLPEVPGKKTEGQQGSVRGERPVITLLGTGPGDISYLTGAALSAIEKADLLIGAGRLLAPWKDKKKTLNAFLPKDILPAIQRAEEAEEEAEKAGKDKKAPLRIAILFSGDSGFYSGCKKMAEALRDNGYQDIRILPGISSIQLLSARTGISWEDAGIVSFHGIAQDAWEEKLLEAMRGHKKVFFLTSGVRDVEGISEILLKNGYADADLFLGIQLSYPEERILHVSPKDAAGKIERILWNTAGDTEESTGKETGKEKGTWEEKSTEKGTKKKESTLVMPDGGKPLWRDALCCGFILLQEDKEREAKGKEESKEERIKAPGKLHLTHSIPDDFFIRGKVPMTKQEIRTLCVEKLKLCYGDTVYDIGSGTGSVAVEMAMLSSSLKVYAVERNEEALCLIKKNKEKAGAFNLIPVKGSAPEALLPLPSADAAFIGGAGGNLLAILKVLRKKNPSMRVVTTAITLESIAAMRDVMKDIPVTDTKILCVGIQKGKKIGAYHLMMAENPIWIFAFRFDGSLSFAGNEDTGMEDKV